MLRSLSEIFINYLTNLSGKEFDDDDKEVYIYGLECLLNTLIVISLLLVWSLFAHRFWETVLWISVFTLTRHYAGGVHAPSELTCILSSVFLGMSNAYIVSYISIPLYAFLFCIIICLLFAPTDVSKFELTLRQKKRYKLKSVCILLLLWILCLLIGSNPLSFSIIYALLCAYTLLLVNSVLHILKKH